MDPEEIRRQLQLAMDFMEATPIPARYRWSPKEWALDMAGEMPAHPEEYEREDWEEENRPIAEIWEAYVQEIEYDARRGWYPELLSYAQDTREFEAQIQGLLEV